jgi:hypothetical protein
VVEDGETTITEESAVVMTSLLLVVVVEKPPLFDERARLLRLLTLCLITCDELIPSSVPGEENMFSNVCCRMPFLKKESVCCFVLQKTPMVSPVSYGST